MYLVDTSVWIDHFNKSEPLLVSFLNDNVVCTHPFIIGEIALGNLRQREIVIGYFQGLPQACVGSDFEVMHFISKKMLHGKGIGYVDAHLVTSALLMNNIYIWTRDKKLLKAAKQLNMAYIEDDSN
ncbi:type II toxin-antitoxin system VapC family toxin [Desulfonatronovibrio magnus]|uniref:type II toxin-antitoxin system VapC family toxin n=1 Tax=Desulfonatronovibrio magnus TaxID=698827 RepID=UPI0005EB665E|nr:PIN domain-containing protein [Desulfonatronovibrio magnus]